MCPSVCRGRSSPSTCSKPPPHPRASTHEGRYRRSWAILEALGWSGARSCRPCKLLLRTSSSCRRAVTTSGDGEGRPTPCAGVSSLSDDPTASAMTGSTRTSHRNPWGIVSRRRSSSPRCIRRFTVSVLTRCRSFRAVGARRGRLGHLTQVAAAHVVDEAAHGKVLGEERRGADRRHIVAHTLLQIRERQEVDPVGVNSEPCL